MAKRKRRKEKSFTTKATELLHAGKMDESMKMIQEGMDYYSKNVMEAVYPYASKDAGMIVMVLRYFADGIEKNNPGAKKFAEGLEKCMFKPEFKEIERVEETKL